MITLQHLLNLPDRIILVDSTIQGGHKIGEEIYDAKNFGEVNYSELRRAQQDLEEAQQVISHKNTRIIPAVSEEIKRFVNIIGVKIKYLTQPIRASKGRRRRMREYGERGETALRAFQTKLHNFYKLAKHNELRINDPRYDALIDLIKLIEVPLELKQDTSYLRGVHDEKMPHFSDTDERLTATLFWLSMFSPQKPVLITGDTDFVSLTSVIPRIIGADTFLPANAEFRKALSKNLYEVYITKQDRDEPNLAVDSSTIGYAPIFNLTKLSTAENKEKQEEVRRLWLEFNKASD